MCVLIPYSVDFDHVFVMADKPRPFQFIRVSLATEAETVVTNNWNQMQLQPGDRPVFVVGKGVDVEVRASLVWQDTL